MNRQAAHRQRPRHRRRRSHRRSAQAARREGSKVWSSPHQVGQPRAAARLQPGDVILMVGRKPVKSADEFNTAVKDAKAGDSVMLLVKREDADAVHRRSVPKRGYQQRLIGPNTAPRGWGSSRSALFFAAAIALSLCEDDGNQRRERGSARGHRDRDPPRTTSHVIQEESFFACLFGVYQKGTRWPQDSGSF